MFDAKFDIAIVGGGISGCCAAYFLQKEGFSVVLYEKNKICSGGSFAAGAFLSPKIGKPSLYKEFINKALNFSLKFYEQLGKESGNDFLVKKGLLKLSKNSQDGQKLLEYENYIDFKYEKLNLKNGDLGFFFEDAGVVEPLGVCSKLVENVTVCENFEIKNINQIKAKKIILALGSDGFDRFAPYLETRTICGHRIDVKTSTLLPHVVHKNVSILANGKIAKIGASSYKNLNCQSDEGCPLTQKDGELLDEAREIYEDFSGEIVKRYFGKRVYSIDYFPFLGELIDQIGTLERYPYIKKGSKVPDSKFVRKENIYIFGALGARGFVSAPYLGHILALHISKNIEIPHFLEPSRMFLKWVRRKQV